MRLSEVVLMGVGAMVAGAFLALTPFINVVLGWRSLPDKYASKDCFGTLMSDQEKVEG